MNSNRSSARPASTDLMLAPSASDAPSQADTGNASNRHLTGVKPDAGAGPLGGLSPRNWPETRLAHEGEHEAPPRTSISRLPAELIGHIADILPPNGVIALADTSRGLRYTLVEEKRSASLIARAQYVDTLDEARELLDEIETHISRPHLQAIPLTVLVETIEAIGQLDARQWLMRSGPPDSVYTTLLDSVWTAITRLPLQYQSEPLESFAPTLRHLSDLQQRSGTHDAFLHQIAQLLPGHRARPLAAFAWQSLDLHPAGRQAMYDAILGHVQQLPAQQRSAVLIQLVPFLPLLTEPAVRFGVLLEATRRLPPQDQGLMLERLRLALTMYDLPEPAAKFDALIEAARQLPAPDQGPMLGRLALTLYDLPEPATTRFSPLLEATRQLPVQYQDQALSQLAPFIVVVLATDQPAFERAMQIIEQFAPEQRTIPLEAFARDIHALAEHARHGRSPERFGPLIRRASIELTRQAEQLQDVVRAERLNQIVSQILRLRPDH